MRANPFSSVDDHTHRRRATWFLRIAFILPTLFAIGAFLLEHRTQSELREAIRWTTQTRQFQRELNRLHLQVYAADLAVRGYLLTGSEVEIGNYRSTTPMIQQASVAVANLMQENPNFSNRWDELDTALQQWLTTLGELEKRATASDREGAMRLFSEPHAKEAADHLDAVISKLRVTQDERLAETQAARQAALDKETSFARLIFVTNIIVLIVLAWLLARLTQAERLINVCAWSRMVEYQGEWLSFEDYLERRFHVRISHGISPRELEKMYAEVDKLAARKTADGDDPIRLG